MIKDIAKGHVLDALRDENIHDHYSNYVLEQLLRLPEKWRQNALAEHTKRTTYTTYHMTASGMYEGEMNYRPGVDSKMELQRIVNEILVQIGALA